MLRLAVNRPQVAAVVCETLVACGSEIDATDYHDRTPLMSAVDCRNQSDIVRSLLALNADTTITDNRGWDVSHTENAEILQLLSEHSKKTVSLVACCLPTDVTVSILFRLWNANKHAWKH